MREFLEKIEAGKAAENPMRAAREAIRAPLA